MTTKLGRSSHSEPNPYESHEPRLGLPMMTLPVFICRQPEACAAVSVWSERITQRSSACLAMFGKEVADREVHSDRDF